VLHCDSTDLVGGTLEARDETTARANFTFIAKQLDIIGDGGDTRISNNSTSNAVVLKSGSSDLRFQSDGAGTYTVATTTEDLRIEGESNPVYIIGEEDATDGRAVYIGVDRIAGGEPTPLIVGERRVELQRSLRLNPVSSSSLPTNALGGDMIAISDDDYKPAYYDGTNWRYVATDVIV